MPSPWSSVMRGRASTTGVPAGAPRRERMRGRLGTCTEGVGGRGHGAGILAARGGGQCWNGFTMRRSAHLLRKPGFERERARGARQVDSGGEGPEQEWPVLEEETPGGRADDPADLPRDARGGKVAADELRRREVDAQRSVDRTVEAFADREDQHRRGEDPE